MGVFAALAGPAAAAERSTAVRWCESELREWERQFGRAVRRVWLEGNGSIKKCVRERARVVEPLEPAEIEGIIALHLGGVEACGAEFRNDPEAFAERYRVRSSSPYSACVEQRGTEAAEIPPTLPQDVDRATRLCGIEQRLWARRGRAKAWRIERGPMSACVQDEAPQLAALRKDVGPGPRIRRAVRALVVLKKGVLSDCLAALRAGKYNIQRPSRTRLGTCTRQLEEARRGTVAAPREDKRIALNLSRGVASAAALLAWLVICVLLFRRGSATATRWGFHAAFSLPLVVACGVVIGSDVFGSVDGYDLESRVKKVVLPIAGVAFLAVTALALRGSPRDLRPRAPDLVAAAILVLALVGAGIGLARESDTLGLLQDLGLSLLFVAGYAAGRVEAWRAARPMPAHTVPALLLLVAVATIAYSPLAPLYGLVPAVAFAAVAATLMGKIHWAWLLPAGGTLAIYIHDSTLGGTVPSSVYLQIATGALVLAYWLSRRYVPNAVWAAAIAVVAVVGIATTDARSIVTADYDGTDLSFAQRVYEAKAVKREVDDSAITTVAGAGLGATLDLSKSPDAETLEAARGDASSVNDVHLLPYDLLRRHGLLGVLWLAGFAAVVLLLAVRSRATGDPWHLLLLLVVAPGLSNALPAASHLFANPFVGFAVGTLVTSGRSTAASIGPRS